MTQTTQQLLTQALELPTSERAELARRLMESISEEDVLASMDPKILSAWRTEVRRRWESYERNESTPVDGEEMFTRLYEKYGT